MERYSLIIEFDHRYQHTTPESRIWRTYHATMKDLKDFSDGLIDHTVYAAEIRDNITGKTVKWLKEPI